MVLRIKKNSVKTKDDLIREKLREIAIVELKKDGKLDANGKVRK